jgi:glucosamine--fructose-6-phosphate aminotransferase (isomerizing)
MTRFIKKVWKYFKHVLRFLGMWNLRIGVEPCTAPPYSIIFLPLYRQTFFCGFAGILTIKTGEPPPQIDPVQTIDQLFSKIRGKDSQSLLSGSMVTGDYLGGNNGLAEIAESVLHLKEDFSFETLFFQPEKTKELVSLVGSMKSFFLEEEKFIEDCAGNFSTTDMEIINARHILMKDITWSMEKDILENIGKILALTGAERVGDVFPEALKKYKKLNFLLNSIDRLEVRGRDSAGISISFTLCDSRTLNNILEELQNKALHDQFQARISSGDLLNGSILFSPPPEGKCASLSFTYKTASIIGELGQNVKALRESIAGDKILQEFARYKTVFDISLAHTRWASVGSITDKNCHPINNYTPTRIAEKEYPRYGKGNWFISAVLNGDVDNYQALRNLLEKEGVSIASDITTDTKIIPLQIEKYLLAGHDLTEAFRLAVGDFEGSHAIAMVSNVEPEKAFLALRGSGQTIYVGLAPDQYLFSSEVYGLVEATPFFLKMDGEKPSHPENPESKGQIFVIDEDSGGGISGIRALCYDGTPLIIEAGSVQKAEITTRDIDRGNYPHFFLKEISESIFSVRKTLRGKYRISKPEAGQDTVVFNLGTDVISEALDRALAQNQIRRIIVIGHGTAAVAGTAIADAFDRYLKGSGIRVEAKVSSELSGFTLESDLSDTLVIPITQSGTTTDTNRAVAMAADRGAAIIAIVNRRQSDITGKADGVFYTSDGRDIEMSVASTKAFYSQIVAGHVLALRIAQILQTLSDNSIAEELISLEQAPHLMKRVLEKSDLIRQSAEKMAKQKKYWAVVGSGPNKAAADEIRIKMSELCYKTISSDITENKKHIDLSAEPLIIVCAAGNPEAVLSDIVKDVAIFKAHKAGVVVFADEGDERFNGIADTVIEIPRGPMPLPVILNTVAGHLWSYYAARSIDTDAIFIREFRSLLNLEMLEHDRQNFSFYERIGDRRLRKLIGDFSARFHEQKNDGCFSLASVKNVSNLALLLKYASGKLPLEDYWLEFKQENGALSPLNVLDISLGQTIDELSRPIDAIRHQAKTVTVGTSRKELIPDGILFDLLKELSFSVKNLITKNILTITRIQPAISRINGYTLYGIKNLDAYGNPTDASTISIAGRGGVSLSMKSRTEQASLLMGTKRSIVSTGHVYVGKGKSDAASIVILPLLDGPTGVDHLILIHVDFNDILSVKEKKEVLGYQFNDIRNLVNEYNLPWDDHYLESIPTAMLLGEPPEFIAGQIKKSLGKENGV